MLDAKDRLEKLRIDATDCEIIAGLATSRQKREIFRQLAEAYRKMAADLEELIESGKLPGA